MKKRKSISPQRREGRKELRRETGKRFSPLRTPRAQRRARAYHHKGVKSRNRKRARGFHH